MITSKSRMIWTNESGVKRFDTGNAYLLYIMNY